MERRFNVGDFATDGIKPDGSIRIVQIERSGSDSWVEWEGEGEPYLFTKNEEFWEGDEDDLQPLILNEKWIEVFGFENPSVDCFTLKTNGRRIGLMKTVNGYTLISNIGGFYFKFVHKLQQFLKSIDLYQVDLEKLKKIL